MIRTKDRLLKFVLILMVIIISSVGIFTKFNILNLSDSNEYNSDNKYEYDTFTSKILDINELLTGKIDGYIYFGRDTCSDCLKFNKVLELEYNSNPDLIIYKFDTDHWRENEKFDDVLNLYEVSEVPVLIKVDNGNLKAVYSVDFENKTAEDIYLEMNKFLYS